MDSPAQRHPAYDNISAEEAMAKRNRSKAEDPIEGVTARYQLAVLKEPLLKVIVGAHTYKAIMAKIEAYEESDRRFERLNNSVKPVVGLDDLCLLLYTHWVFDGWIYDDECQRVQVAAEEYSNAKKPNDGEIYRKIRQYHFQQNLRFEWRW